MQPWREGGLVSHCMSGDVTNVSHVSGDVTNVLGTETGLPMDAALEVSHNLTIIQNNDFHSFVTIISR